MIRYSPRRKGSNWSKYDIARAWKLMNEGKMTPAGIARLPPDVHRVWERRRPPVVITDRSGGINPEWEISFSDGKDYLSKIKMTALAP